MRIIEHGNLNTRYFKCPHCGYKFIADMRDYAMDIDRINFWVDCPECDRRFDQHAPLYKEGMFNV